MGYWIASAKSWQSVVRKELPQLSSASSRLVRCATLGRTFHVRAQAVRLRPFDLAQSELRRKTEAVPRWRFPLHPYCLACATFSVQGTPPGSSEQNGFRAFGAFENEIGIESLPPSSVLTSCNRPSLPAITMVPPSGDISAVMGIALF